jgi:hypothetical protein
MSVAVVPQLVFWTSYTVLAGLLGAGIAALLTSPSGTPKVPTTQSVEMAPLEQD